MRATLSSLEVAKGFCQNIPGFIPVAPHQDYLGNSQGRGYCLSRWQGSQGMVGRQGEGYMWAFSHGNAGQVLDRRKSVQLGLLQNWFQGGLKANVREGRDHA